MYLARSTKGARHEARDRLIATNSTARRTPACGCNADHGSYTHDTQAGTTKNAGPDRPDLNRWMP